MRKEKYVLLLGYTRDDFENAQRISKGDKRTQEPGDLHRFVKAICRRAYVCIYLISDTYVIDSKYTRRRDLAS